MENVDFDFKRLSGQGQRSRISEERNYSKKKNENLPQIRFLFSCLFTCNIANLKSHCILMAISNLPLALFSKRFLVLTLSLENNFIFTRKQN